MVKKRGIVWNYFEKKVDGTQVIAFCKFCDQSYTQNATRMEKHMERCPKCPDDIKMQFIQVGVTKRSKARILGNSMENWVKQDNSIEGNITETEVEEIDNWEYRNQNYADEGSSSAPQTVELIMQDDESWVGRETELENADHEETITKAEWIASQASGQSNASSQEQPRQSQRKVYIPRRISQWPIMTPRVHSNHSPLQSKIYQEQLLEKRALRRIAELELRRKTMEFERFQWEYERDKAQSEVKWAHDTRMMQLKEERERQLIEQSRAGIPRILSCTSLQAATSSSSSSK
ncbi:uncharacterized protein LOC122507033 isoform X1 [Leptopilina heterotoma]|uniref:uncharacterized protein LOC122507033 isoform X1 n=1 Tax=Leptopilina heterotoma TaxID=63436 RepID=UPI001CA82F66|nr:uncharacterized protein LOC122507033 isoform X1 [Leptopilina heterotoma]XP_043475474.1 uncharacterized protein LOC122507033 isoform X1 [Leptopilina heterotoma]